MESFHCKKEMPVMGLPYLCDTTKLKEKTWDRMAGSGKNTFYLA
jgi:hypothetical protein